MKGKDCSPEQIFKKLHQANFRLDEDRMVDPFCRESGVFDMGDSREKFSPNKFDVPCFAYSGIGRSFQDESVVLERLS